MMVVNAILCRPPGTQPGCLPLATHPGFATGQFFGWDRGYLTRSHGHRSALGSAEYSGRGTRKMAAGKRKPEATQGKPRNDIIRKTQSLLSVYRFCNCKVTYRFIIYSDQVELEKLPEPLQTVTEK